MEFSALNGTSMSYNYQKRYENNYFCHNYNSYWSNWWHSDCKVQEFVNHFFKLLRFPLIIHGAAKLQAHYCHANHFERHKIHPSSWSISLKFSKENIMSWDKWNMWYIHFKCREKVIWHITYSFLMKRLHQYPMFQWGTFYIIFLFKLLSFTSVYFKWQNIFLGRISYYDYNFLFVHSSVLYKVFWHLTLWWVLHLLGSFNLYKDILNKDFKLEAIYYNFYF